MLNSHSASTRALSNSHAELVRLSVLLLVALGARLLGIELQPLWWDEGFSVYFATETPSRLLELTSLDIHPPLYYLMLQGWYPLVGEGAVQSRWLSVLLGVLALPLTWRAVRDLAGNRVAWVATLFLTFSPFHIYYSQEVRMYALMVVVTLAAVVAWRRRRWFTLGIFVLAGLYTQYYFALIVGALAVIVLDEIRRKVYGWRGPSLSLVVAVAGYLPWVLYALPRLITYVGGKLVVEADRPMTPLEFLPRHLTAWSMGHLSVAATGLSWIALLYATLIAIGVAVHYFTDHARDRGSSATGTLLLFWLFPVTGIFLIGLFAPFTDARIERQLLFVLPFFLALAAMGVVAIWRRSKVFAIAAMVVILLFDLLGLADFYTVPRYPREDYRLLLADLSAMQAPGDAWLAIYEWQIGYLRAYLPALAPSVEPVDLSWATDADALDGAIAELLRRHPRIWLPAYQVKGRIFEEQLASSLASEGITAWDDWYGNTRLILFGRAPGGATESAEIGEYPGFGVVQADADVESVASGTGLIPVILQGAPAVDGARVSLQLVGRGSVWGEWDGAFQNGVVRAGIPVAPGTPPGEYAVRATLYDPETLQPYQRFEDGFPAEPEALVRTVSVIRPPEPLDPARLQRLAGMPQSVELGASVGWLGAAVDQRELLQGDILPITLFWQSMSASSADARVFVQGFDESGELKFNHEQPPVNGTWPLSEWQPGDLVRDPHRVHVPADLTPGEYRLTAGLFDAASGERLRDPEGHDSLELGEVTVGARDRILSEPALGDPASHPFGDVLAITRLEIAGDPRRGEPVRLTVVWRSGRTGASPLNVFAQLYRGDTQLYSSDHPFEPPATSWVTAEYIVDEHEIPALPAGPGPYHLRIGVYDPASGAPLASAEGAYVTLRTWE